MYHSNQTTSNEFNTFDSKISTLLARETLRMHNRTPNFASLEASCLWFSNSQWRVCSRTKRTIERVCKKCRLSENGKIFQFLRKTFRSSSEKGLFSTTERLKICTNSQYLLFHQAANEFKYRFPRLMMSKNEYKTVDEVWNTGTRYAASSNGGGSGRRKRKI